MIFRVRQTYFGYFLTDIPPKGVITRIEIQTAAGPNSSERSFEFDFCFYYGKSELFSKKMSLKQVKISYSISGQYVVSVEIKIGRVFVGYFFEFWVGQPYENTLYRVFLLTSDAISFFLHKIQSLNLVFLLLID